MSALPLPPARVLRWVGPLLLALVALPWVVEPYQTTLFSYGLVMAIAALGFNLLLGYTGLLSFGHSAYFGAGAYAVALIVKYLKVSSLEILIVGGILASAAISALFGFLCVRYTKIFFGILTLALSQVLRSLAFKFFWVTGGSDGLRVPTIQDSGLDGWWAGANAPLHIYDPDSFRNLNHVHGRTIDPNGPSRSR